VLRDRLSEEDSAIIETIKRVAWVTGASQGIGAAVSRRLARDGWIVAASARSADKLHALSQEAEHLPGSIVVFPLDVTDEPAVERVFADIEARLGPVQLAILNAGTHEPIPATEFSVVWPDRGCGLAGRISWAPDRKRLRGLQGRADQYV